MGKTSVHIIQATPEIATRILRWQRWLERYGSCPSNMTAEDAVQHAKDLTDMLTLMTNASVVSIGEPTEIEA